MPHFSGNNKINNGLVFMLLTYNHALVFSFEVFYQLAFWSFLFPVALFKSFLLIQCIITKVTCQASPNRLAALTFLLNNCVVGTLESLFATRSGGWTGWSWVGRGRALEGEMGDRRRTEALFFPGGEQFESLL